MHSNADFNRKLNTSEYCTRLYNNRSIPRINDMREKLKSVENIGDLNAFETEGKIKTYMLLINKSILKKINIPM